MNLPTAPAVLAEKLIHILTNKGLTLFAAESCGGGLLGATLTAIPGASRAFLGSVVAYSDNIKIDMLNVSPRTLAMEGAVSAHVAHDMAQGAADLAGDITVAITGITSPPPPDTPTSKPTGLTYIAIVACYEDGTRQAGSFGFTFEGDRAQIRALAVEKALTLLIEHLGETP